MAKIYFNAIDISNHQGDADFDLDKVLTKNPSIKMVIIKSSEGTGFDDAYDEKFIKIALAHGCIVFVYHFARPSRNGWQKEADFFLSLTLKYKGKVGYCLDWEDKGGASKASWAKSWLDYVAKKTESTPIFYSYESMINANDYSSLVNYPLWCARYRDHVADYNFDMSYAGTAPNVKWWPSYIAWQWTSSGRLDGYNGNLDCSVFYVPEDTVKGYIGGKVAEEVKEEVKYTFATTDPVQISNSGSDENGNYRNGKAGDNNGKEWRIRTWYNRPWNCVLRHPNANVRSYIAELAVRAAKNDKIGYDQNQRNTYWNQLKAVGYDPSKITVACESDCSAGVIANTKAVGYLLNIDKLKNIGASYTGNMRSAYVNAGFTCMTADKYTDQDDYLLAGDILLNDASHTATVVTNGKLSGAEPRQDTASDDYPLLKRGSKGTAVKFLQTVLGGLEVDGSFGAKTEARLIAWQRINGCDPDGEAWVETYTAMIPTLPMLKRGSQGRYVRALQIALGGLEVDGSFGYLTQNAVLQFQSDNDIETDSVVGPITWEHIIKSL